MKRNVLVILLLFFPLLIPAQSTTGNLEGRVSDQTGTAIAGATVVATSPHLQGSRAVSTDERGFFRMLALPTGKYRVTVRHLSFVPATIENVMVWLGNTATVSDVVLQQTTVEMAEVVVSGQRPLLDPSSTTSGGNLLRENFEILPIDRNFRSIASLVPQANQSFFGDEVNIAGSTGAENIYVLDGMNVTDPMWGVTNANLPYNFIREIQVKTGGYEAEFGHALGGIMNVVTHSGGNDLQGQVFGFFTNNALHTSPKIGVSDTKFEKSSQYDVGLSIGGPIIRDQLWFYSAYNPTFESRVSSFPGAPALEDKSTQHLFAGKLTWQPTPALGLTLTLLGDPSTRPSVGPGGFFGFPGSVLNADPVLGTVTKGGTAASLRGQYVLGSDYLLTGSVSRLDRRFDNKPRTWSSGSTLPPRLDDYVNGFASGGYGALETRTMSRTSLQAAITAIMGSHVVKVGAEYVDTYLDTKDEYSVILRYVDSSYTWFHYLGDGKASNRTPTIYVQDSWHVSDHVRINVGLRWDAQYFVDAQGSVKQSITDEIQPRFGFIFEPGESGTQKVFGSIGRFYEQLPGQPIAFWYGGWSQTIVVYSQNPMVNPNGGVTSSSVGSTPFANVPDLKGEYFDEIALGYERLIMEDLRFGLRANYRVLQWAIEDGIGPDNVNRMGNPGRGLLSYLPKARREYAALELTLERTAVDGLSYAASYVLSRNYGNYTGLTATDLTSIGSNAGPQFDLVGQTVNGTGLLPNDKTHVLKLFGSYRWAFGLGVGTGFVWQSGMPLNEYGTPAPGTAPYWSFVRQRGTAGRAPSNWDLSFRFSYDVQIPQWATTRPRLLLDLFHVGNPQAPVTYDQVHYTDVDANGNQTSPNGNYGKVTHYQPPMSVRLGLEVSF